MYFVRLRGADGKRLTKSLETKNPVVAAKRAHQALEDLQSVADGPAQQRWRADEPGVEWTIPSKPDGTNDYVNAVAKPITASDVLEPQQLNGTEWRDLVNEAVAVRKRKKGDVTTRLVGIRMFGLTWLRSRSNLRKQHPRRSELGCTRCKRKA